MNLLRRIRQALWGTTTNVFRAAAPADSKSAPTDALETNSYPLLYNETNFDRQRNNVEFTVFSSGARTAPVTSSTFTNHNARGVTLFLNITAVSGTSPTLQPWIDERDPTSGANMFTANWPIQSAITRKVHKYYPAVSDNLGTGVYVQGLQLARRWRVRVSIGGTNPSFTFSIGACYCL